LAHIQVLSVCISFTSVVAGFHLSAVCPRCNQSRQTPFDKLQQMQVLTRPPQMCEQFIIGIEGD